MSFGRRLRKAVSKLNFRRGSKSRAESRAEAAPDMIHPSQSFLSRPYETPAGVGASESPPPPPVAQGRELYVSTGSPNRTQPEPSQVHRLSAMGPDPEPENRNYGESSLGEERTSEENRRQSYLRRSPTNISTSSSDYSNHSISNSLSPTTPVPSVGRALMGSHLADTPPPTPPDSVSKDDLDPAWGEDIRERGHAPLVPQMSFIQRNSAVAPGELRTEEALSQLRTTGDGRGYVHGQFTPQDSPITGQTPHDIPVNATSETSHSTPLTRPQEIEQITDPLHDEIPTPTADIGTQPAVTQGHPPTKDHLETPTSEAVEPADEQTRQGDWGEVPRGEWATNEDGGRESRTHDDSNRTDRKTTDNTAGLLARPEESEPTEVEEPTAGPSHALMTPSQPFC
ncbi:hypothetical protein C7212DRAFT_360567 [Tuber magnatum]|uniref:Uncharacterized protein n=1 Tax=Tuber magnatum TaxID=42249 RepID=A0A317SEP5_9PEZI|nr:hypothetical protein C7212DRAFT_360567 [Tuber magnatum]